MSPCREDTLVALRNFVKNIPYIFPKHKHQFRKGAIRISYGVRQKLLSAEEAQANRVNKLETRIIFLRNFSFPLEKHTALCV